MASGPRLEGESYEDYRKRLKLQSGVDRRRKYLRFTGETGVPTNARKRRNKLIKRVHQGIVSQEEYEEATGEKFDE